LLDVPLLQDLGQLLIGATLLALLAQRAQIPSIVAFIVAGLLLGPGLGRVEVDHTLEMIAEVGILLLLFLVGLELSLGKIREVGGLALGAGAAQVLLTGLGVAGIAWGFGRSADEILFLGVALTFSSTVVVVKLLDQTRSVGKRFGQIAVGILLVQDLVVILVLTFVGGLSGGGVLSTRDLLLDLGRAFGGMLLLLGAAAGIGWKLLPPTFAWISRSQPALLSWSLAWCFLLVLGAEVLGLSLELGAFVAGVTLAQLPYHHDLRRRVHPLMNFFVAIFFVTLGVQMELGAALSAWPLVLGLTLFTLLAKPILIAWLVRGLGETPGVALRSGLTLGQTSEFSFILAALALANGLVRPDLLSMIGAVGLLTMALSSFSILRVDALTENLLRRFRLPLLTAREDTALSTSEAGEGPAGPQGHVIVIGMNSLGRQVVAFLVEQGAQVLAVDTDPWKLQGLPCATLLGNSEYSSVLDEAGLPSARLLVSTLRIEGVNRLLAYQAARLRVPCVIHAYDSSVEREMGGIPVSHYLNSRSASVDETLEKLAQQGILGR
jgi:Kef-type K+ transport system membrane component KefB